MSNFTSASMLAAIEFAVDEVSTANAGAQRDNAETLNLTGTAEQFFGDGESLGLIFKVGVDARALADKFCEWYIAAIKYGRLYAVRLILMPESLSPESGRAASRLTKPSAIAPAIAF